jgi:hypothetical protein
MSGRRSAIGTQRLRVFCDPIASLSTRTKYSYGIFGIQRDIQSIPAGKNGLNARNGRLAGEADREERIQAESLRRIAVRVQPDRKKTSKLLIFMSNLSSLLVITDRADCGGFL